MEKRLKIDFTFGQHLNTTAILLVAVTILLLGLWIPVLIDQMANFITFQSGMLLHSFPDWIGHALIWGLPILETLVIALLVSPKTNHYGMRLSSLLMLGFTTYVGLGVMTNLVTFECFCSKLIADKSWWWHFRFNLTFLAISMAGIYLKKLQRGGKAGGRAIEGGSAKRPQKDIKQ